MGLSEEADRHPPMPIQSTSGKAALTAEELNGQIGPLLRQVPLLHTTMASRHPTGRAGTAELDWATRCL